MTDHTPTTEETAPGPIGDWFRRIGQVLADHERKIAAEAWDQGYESATEFMTGPDWGASPQNPYRADRIEQGGES